jgi:hypothetical protein
MLAGAMLLAAGLLGLAFDQPEESGRRRADTAAPAPTTTTASSTTTTTLPPVAPAVIAFYRELERAVRSGDVEFLVARLDPLVLARYGEAQCRDFLGGLAIPTFRVRVRQVDAPAPWRWEVDGAAAADVPDAVTVHVERAAGAGDANEAIEHVAVRGRDVRWFTDCGTPA